MRTSLTIGYKHKVYLEKLLLEAHENKKQVLQSEIHRKFQREFAEISSSTLRPYILMAKYAVNLLNNVHTSERQKFSREIEKFTYELIKRGHLTGRKYTAKEMFQLLSERYP